MDDNYVKLPQEDAEGAVPADSQPKGSTASDTLAQKILDSVPPVDDTSVYQRNTAAPAQNGHAAPYQAAQNPYPQQGGTIQYQVPQGNPATQDGTPYSIRRYKTPIPSKTAIPYSIKHRREGLPGQPAPLPHISLLKTATPLSKAGTPHRSRHRRALIQGKIRILGRIRRRRELPGRSPHRGQFPRKTAAQPSQKRKN